jgi:hypothetical protein
VLRHRTAACSVGAPDAQPSDPEVDRDERERTPRELGAIEQPAQAEECGDRNHQRDA